MRCSQGIRLCGCALHSGNVIQCSSGMCYSMPLPRPFRLAMCYCRCYAGLVGNSGLGIRTCKLISDCAVMAVTS